MGYKIEVNLVFVEVFNCSSAELMASCGFFLKTKPSMEKQAFPENLFRQDGTTMQIARLPDIDEGTWEDVKKYVEGILVEKSQRANKTQLLSCEKIFCVLWIFVVRLHFS